MWRDGSNTYAPRQEPAVNDDRVAVCITCRGAHQVNRGAHELFGLAESSLRRVGFEKFSARRAFDQLAVQIRWKNTRRDSVYSNAILRPLIGQASDDP